MTELRNILRFAANLTGRAFELQQMCQDERLEEAYILLQIIHSDAQQISELTRLAVLYRHWLHEEEPQQ